MSLAAAFAVPHPPLIIPAVGNGREQGIQNTIDAYREVGSRIAELAPDVVVISSPHATLYRDYFHISPGTRARGSFAAFGAPQAAYEVAYDNELVDAIVRVCEEEGISAGTDYERDPALDHATMIPVHFMREAHVEAPIVRVGLSGMNAGEHLRLGRAIARAAKALGRRFVFIASGDLSHKLLADGPYGFAAEGPEFDRRICADFAKGDLLDILAIDPGFAERAAECGLRSFQIMAGVLEGAAPFDSELLSYEGPFGVGYGIAAFTPKAGEAPETDLLHAWHELRAHDLSARKAAEDAHVRLARASLEAYVRSGTRIEPGQDLPSELLSTRAGCFVSLKVDGQLRGCIGTIEPTRASLAEEICANAISAGCADPRFSPVRADELDELVYDVDVLGAPEVARSLDELDSARYGVIVSTRDGRRGLLLPDLEGVDSVEEQLEIAARKGGIDLVGDEVLIERFEVVRHL